MPHPLHRSDSIRLLDLQAFCAVAEHLSFVTAARTTGMSTSTVTRSVQSLEQGLGCELVSRSRRHVTLTVVGEAYYQSVKAALRQLASAKEELVKNDESPEGWVRFSAPPILESNFLPQVLEKISCCYPNVRVDITFTDVFIEPAEAGLDFAIRGGYPAGSGLVGQTLWRYERVLCASPGYVARFGLPLDPKSLADHQFVIHTGPRLIRAWRLKMGEDVFSIPAVATHRVSSGAGLLSVVEAGMGVGRIADWIARPLFKSGRLVRVCPGYTAVCQTGQSAEMHVVHANHMLSRSSRAVISVLHEFAPISAGCPPGVGAGGQ